MAYDVHIDADYTGGFTIAIKYAAAGVQPWQEPYLRLLHNGQDITQGVDRVNKVVFGYSTTASPFAVAIGGQATPDVEAPDLWPPFTTLEPIEDVYIDGQGGNFISTGTTIGLLAEDDRGGMVDTYYTPDLTEALFETGLVPASLGQFMTYSPGITLPEGVRRLGYGSADAAGNYELLKEATFYVDGTPPVTRLTVDGMEYPAGAEIYVVEGASIALDAMDPVSNGVASGVEEIAWLADIDPESCPEDDGEGDDEGPPGTCGNSRYAGPFTLAEGSHTVHYFSSDHVGNAEMRSVRIYVDGTPPEVWLHAAGSTVPDGGEAYLIEGDSITLEALDPISNGVASGLNEAEYLIDVTFDSCPPEEEDGGEEGEGGEGDGEEGEGEDEEDDGPRGTCGNSGYEGPFTLTPGTHTVYYLAHDMVMNASAVKTAHFTVAPSSGAAEASITPSSGPIGLPFTITGEGFGTYSAGTTLALIGGATAPLTLWTDTQIKGTVPGSLAAGEYPVVVMRGSEVLAETSSFTVVVPALADITPSSGPIGLPFALNGTGFGNYVANYTRVLIGGTTCPLTLWTDTQIKGTIPGTIAPGMHEVLVERALNGGLVRSATVMFDLRNMEADWIAPSSGPIGMPFTIVGSGFGNYVANYTTVLMGGATCPLTLWTDGQIKGTVPGGLATGQYPVLVERRTADGGVMHSPEMSFTVLAVDTASMTPVAGPIGIPFTIYGAGFGNYSAGWTRVLIGGTTAPLTLWSDTQIKGTVPGVLAAGPHEVIVERELNGGLIRSSALNFDVVTPSAQLITPSSGPIGLPFVLDGTGFGNYVANYTRVLIGGTTCPLTLWTDTQIKGTVPGTIASGAHEVIVQRQLSGGLAVSQPLAFTLTVPALSAITPSSGPI
ncbi:MAG TPA: IPT/TIG domain-containing protein, partial [Elusimicrobiales bacterium]|nr:IPT/TIG domain-containing protein [Elusimicrobiales bacterium]